MRLDQYAAQHWPEYSRSSWQKFIAEGKVTVNGIPVTTTKYDVSDSDSVDVVLPKAPDYSKNNLPIIYEDEHVIVFNKPVGVLTHAKGEIAEEFTVADYMKSRTSYHQTTNRPGIVHRLDRATSGVLLCVKTDEAGLSIARQFSQRTLKKEYEAVVDGVPNERKALLELPLERNPKAPSTFRVNANGKSAETLYEVTQAGNKYSMVTLAPRTGRTHQLRVHMAYLHTPIHGDELYGKAADRLYLHAKRLEVTLPGGERRVFEVPTPAVFTELLAT